jgi:hypothetical protein
MFEYTHMNMYKHILTYSYVPELGEWKPVSPSYSVSGESGSSSTTEKNRKKQFSRIKKDENWN